MLDVFTFGDGRCCVLVFVRVVVVGWSPMLAVRFPFVGARQHRTLCVSQSSRSTFGRSRRLGRVFVGIFVCMPIHPNIHRSRHMLCCAGMCDLCIIDDKDERGVFDMLNAYVRTYSHKIFDHSSRTAATFFQTRKLGGTYTNRYHFRIE